MLATNPLDRVEWRAPLGSMAIDVATVPAPTDIQAIVDHVSSLSSAGARYSALFATVGIAGMRPSDAIGLRVPDLELPARGSGLASVRGSVPSPGSPYTPAGSLLESTVLQPPASYPSRFFPLLF